MIVPSASDLLPIAEAAAEAIIACRGESGGNSSQGQAKADLTSHEVLMHELARFGFPVVSEENDLQLPKEGLAWLIDPLDGTSDFLKGRKDWCVMIALLQDLQPVRAVVHAPEWGISWWADLGKGAFTRVAGEMRSARVSETDERGEIRMLASVSHSSARAEAVAVALGASTRAVGSIGIKLGEIALGNAECYWSPAPLGEWDVCAPSLILTEAGGKVTDIDGGPIRYGSSSRRLLRGFAASNGPVHEVLIRAGAAA